MRPLRLSLLVTLAGCAASPGAVESVRPGINDAYANPDVGQWVERFEREGREIFDERLAIVAACGIRPGDTVADVGAGTGLFTTPLAEAVGPAGTVYAVDIVPEFIEHIEERARAAGHDNVRTVLCTERSVELPPGSVDLVYTCDTYHHFEYPRSTLGSIHEALRPGGALVVIDFERIEGVSSEFVMGHVRAGKATVIAEIEASGFELEREIEGLLERNYFLRFRRR